MQFEYECGAWMYHQIVVNTKCFQQKDHLGIVCGIDAHLCLFVSTSDVGTYAVVDLFDQFTDKQSLNQTKHTTLIKKCFRSKLVSLTSCRIGSSNTNWTIDEAFRWQMSHMILAKFGMDPSTSDSCAVVQCTVPGTVR